jgi:hypothetical protein
MITDFLILSGSTVPQSYNWDEGAPFSPGVAEVSANSTTNYISGYAPGLKVLFANNSVPDSVSIFNNTYLDYTWNFGDYYNDGGNVISLSCVIPVEHIFIMPGKYTISLTQTQTIQETIVDVPQGLCLDKYNLNWYWDNLQCSQVDAKTWNDTQCGAAHAKWWDSELQCFQKYCRFWNWEKLRSVETNNRVKWEETIPGAQYQKRWFFEANDSVCSVPDITTTINTKQQAATKQYIVEVKELSPRAALHSVTQPASGISPYVIRLTPKITKTGSFPIDRIDWDFGDGSPIKTVVRQGDNLNDPELSFNYTYTGDTLDPRNYDALHTYTRDINTYSLFYPSITAYSANTGTSDSCSTLIGPILLPNITPNAIKFTKAKNTLNGILYTAVYDETCTFFTTVTSPQMSGISVKYTTPTNRLQNSFGLLVNYTGNRGLEYPPPIPSNCAQAVLPALEISVLLQEENVTTTGPLSSYDAIMQEDDSYILI